LKYIFIYVFIVFIVFFLNMIRGALQRKMKLANHTVAIKHTNRISSQYIQPIRDEDKFHLGSTKVKPFIKVIREEDKPHSSLPRVKSVPLVFKPNLKTYSTHLQQTTNKNFNNLQVNTYRSKDRKSENILNEFIVGATMNIEYIDNNGIKTKRKVTISRKPYTNKVGKLMVSGYCHLRNEQRTFNISKIKVISTKNRKQKILKSDSYKIKNEIILLELNISISNKKIANLLDKRRAVENLSYYDEADEYDKKIEKEKAKLEYFLVPHRKLKQDLKVINEREYQQKNGNTIDEWDSDIDENEGYEWEVEEELRMIDIRNDWL